LWNAGILNVVATLGTALTRAQVDLLRRYTPRAVAVFDPDEAGRKALARSLELFLAGNVHAKAVILPDGYDPDTFVRTRGREQMDELLAQAWPMADYYIEKILGGRGTLEEDRDKLREAVNFISRLDDAVDRNLFVKKVAEQLHVDEEVLKAEIQRGHSHASAAPALPPRRKTALEMDHLELSLIRMMLEYPGRLTAVGESGVLDCFRTEELKPLGEGLLAMGRQEKEMGDIPSLIGALTDGPLRERLLSLLVQESPYQEELIDRVMADTIRQIKRKWYKERHMILQREIRKADQAEDREVCNALLREKEKLQQEEKRLA
jgi:DNA primase